MAYQSVYGSTAPTSTMPAVSGSIADSGIGKLGRASSLRNSVVELAKNNIRLDRLRSLPAFAGIGETQPYKPPSKDQLVARVKFNLQYFVTNYVALTVTIALVAVLLNPIFVVLMIALFAIWLHFSKMQSDVNVVIAGVQLDQRARNMLLTGSTIFLVIYFGGDIIFTVLGVSATAIAVHSVFRNYPMEDTMGYDRLDSMPVDLPTLSPTAKPGPKGTV